MKVNNQFTNPNPEPVNPQGSKFNKVILVLLLLAVGFLVGLRYGEWSRTGTLTPERLDYSSLDDLYNVIRQEYDGEIKPADLMAGAKKGMVEGLGDPYSSYFTADEAQEYLNDLEGTFEGIGAELGQVEGKLTIVSVIDGSPAQKNELKAGDVIAKVGEETSIEWTPEQGVAKIRGEAGSVVVLTLLRDSNVLEKSITRAKITDPSVRWEVKSDNIGYIRISRFGESETLDLARSAVKELKDQGVKGVVVDLRGNGGGYVSAAQSIAGIWLNYGLKIVEERTSSRVLSTATSTGPATLADMPTVILVNEYTASASEILAGALRDNGRAQLLGSKTYGKGVVQSMRSLADGGRLKLTIAKWYTPSGVNLAGEGLTPDVELAFDAERYKTTNEDNQLQEAIAILKR